MRLRILVGSLALPLMVVSQLSFSSAAATEPVSISPSEEVMGLCAGEGPTEILEPEVVGACSTAADLARFVPPVKQPEGVDSSTTSAALEPGFVFPRIPVAVGPPPKELALPATVLVVPPYRVEDNHDVRRFLDQFQTGYRRAVVERWLVRAGRYLPMVLDVFKQKGLPEELVFTAMIESGFDPLAASRAGAKGLWQFMAPTARRYGLRVDNWLDERLDPEKSTVAAARHFLDLYAVFGSWNLAQAAYNAGERTVVEAIRAMGTSDFWALARGRWLRDETKNFVPAIQAATMIAREPERYGFMVTPAAPLMYDLVSVPRSTSLKQLATRAGLDPDALERLNPELRLKQTPPDGVLSLEGSSGRRDAGPNGTRSRECDQPFNRGVSQRCPWSPVPCPRFETDDPRREETGDRRFDRQALRCIGRRYRPLEWSRWLGTHPARRSAAGRISRSSRGGAGQHEVKVEVHLFATLSGYLPDGTTGDWVALEVPEGSTVADVVRALEIPDNFDCVKVVNGHDTPSDHLLADKDVVSLFPPLVGG